MQIIPYSGSGLGLGAGGDSVRLWNDTTTDTTDTVAQATFGVAQTGVTFNYNPVTGAFGGASVLGVNGVLRAAVTPDIGSPGRILAPLVKPSLRITRSASNVRIGFDAAEGRRYSLEARNDFSTDTWEPTGDTFTATNDVPAYFDQDASAGSRFFRVQAE